MADQLNDNVYTTCFTPREFQVELLDAALNRNIIACLDSTSTKLFLSIKLIQELAHNIRNNLKKSIYLTNSQSIKAIGACLRYLTDLKVETIVDIGHNDQITSAQVIITTREIFSSFLVDKSITFDFINLLIVDECHIINENDLQNIMKEYGSTAVDKRPRVLGLSTSLLQASGSLSTLEYSVDTAERIMHCTVETASEIVTLLRYSNKPQELIIECAKPIASPLEIMLERIIFDSLEFLQDHRYDPFELYTEEFQEELEKIPDPKLNPLTIFEEFLSVLHGLGPWCADRAALVLLMRIEKLKVKIPYERHYLLLCMASSVLIQIRCICCDTFKPYSELERVTEFSSPKISRLIELFEQLKPESSRVEDAGQKRNLVLDNDVAEKALNGQICDNCDSSKLVQNQICDNSPVPSSDKTKDCKTDLSVFRAEKMRNRKGKMSRKINYNAFYNSDSLCGIIFVESRLTARVLFYLLFELSRHHPQLNYISVQYTVDKTGDGTITDMREIEQEHRNQEEVLKKFRMHECNLLVATSILENGIDIPKCNAVIHFDQPKHYRSYAHCKGRARVPGAQQVFFVIEDSKEQFVRQLAEYYNIEKILLRKCYNQEPPHEEEIEADEYLNQVEIYRPKNSEAFVNLCTAIALLNRYCARLPSDTFTRLTPIWTISKTETNQFQCTVRLPINSPLKRSIIGIPMKSRVLARRMTALKACKALHEAGELDDNLLPIGKEGFRALESDWDNFPLDQDDEILARSSAEPRPGTTKRRQYYSKRIAESLVDCKPKVGEPAYLYHIDMVLTCPLPEEQNTRGRRIYPPEDSLQGFGILTLKPIPKICSFPIFTRSGEVGIQLELSKTRVVLDELQLLKIYEFLNYMFTSVLRLQKYLMMYDPEAAENSYFIIPTYKNGPNDIDVDWKFLDCIYESKDLKPNIVPEEERKSVVFDSSKYQDAVVMPWYRNQDQPQYFYVAEICYQLNPKSAFPGADYNTFEQYYFEKYKILIQNSEQPLLDVDHTSARLNFLTPRYVNRKGVALPTSSEETKRAKRENLEQKQILVPELCTVHPFPASLWRKAVCLPCILYRINALLLADEIRKKVAHDLSLGLIHLDSSFQWPPLDFGWSLAAVLKQSNEAKQNKAKELEIKSLEPTNQVEKENQWESKEEKGDSVWMEIGTWSNEIASDCDNIVFDQAFILPTTIRYSSPTNEYNSYSDEFDDSSSNDSFCPSIDDSVQTGLRIEFKGDTAEAIEDDQGSTNQKPPDPIISTEHAWNELDPNQTSSELSDSINQFNQNVQKQMLQILEGSNFVTKTTPIKITRNTYHHKIVSDSNSISDPSKTIWTIDSIERNVYSRHEWESSEYCCGNQDSVKEVNLDFSFDKQPNLKGHPGPSPSVVLQALTMSNANDGINLERLETIGDSFLKYAITTYLYCTYENVHEGKLSHLRSKQVSNLNLYRLGRRKLFGESMIATKFEPHDNWLPPCYYVPKEFEQALIDARIPNEMNSASGNQSLPAHESNTCFIPYNLLTQQSIPDKSVADCVEALIGAYLIECGPRGALLFMAWLGIRVLPLNQLILEDLSEFQRPIGSLLPEKLPDGTNLIVTYGTLKSPRSPLLCHAPNPKDELKRLLDGYEAFEDIINYKFRDRSYLLQALTHASYCPNSLTDCYQRLEFLGDAVLDYLITRHLYEDARQHSPGALTDLRSALVNNTIFASLAVRYGFHKYFRHLSPGLHEVIDRFVRIQETNGHLINEQYYLIEEDEFEEAEDVEVPKALGDVFESVAGAIFLDSAMSLDAVWKVYYRMMKIEIDLFSSHVPKSPIRELLELEPETAKFGKPEKLADGRRVRVTVEVFGKGIFKGIGRNYRIAKCTAAKCALKQLKKTFH